MKLYENDNLIRSWKTEIIYYVYNYATYVLNMAVRYPNEQIIYIQSLI